MKKLFIVLCFMFLSFSAFAAGEGEGTSDVTPAIVIPSAVTDFTWTFLPGAAAYVAGDIHFFWETAFGGIPYAITVTAIDTDDITVAWDAIGCSLSAITTAKGSTITAIASGITVTASVGSFTWSVLSDPDGSGTASAISSEPVVLVATPTATPTKTPHVSYKYLVDNQQSAGKEIVHDGAIGLWGMTIMSMTIADATGNSAFVFDTNDLNVLGTSNTQTAWRYTLFFKEGLDYPITIPFGTIMKSGRATCLEFKTGVGINFNGTGLNAVYHFNKPLE